MLSFAIGGREIGDMYKVLLADDEMLDLEGMKTFIPWPELGLEVAAAVNSGFEACEVLDREGIDILVTDIRMPNMSGLELAKRAREKRRGLRVVFVSGHRDFQYAKQAMELNAGGYVLKPMDDREFIETLIRVREELDSEKRRQEKEESYRRLVPFAKNEYLLRLLESAPGSVPDSAEGRGLDREYGLDRLALPARVALLEIDDYSWKLNPFSETERRALMNRYDEVLISYLEEISIEHVCRVANRRTACLLGSDADPAALEALISRIASSFPFTVTAGLGRPAPGLSGLHASYREAGEALERKMLRGKGRVIEYAEGGGSDLEDLRGLDASLEGMLRAIVRYDLVRVHDELSAVFGLASRLGSKITIQRFAMYAVMKLSEQLKGMNEDLYGLLGLEFKNLDILLQFETIEEIEGWMRRKAFELSEILQAKKQSRNGKLIESVIGRAKERLQGSITLRELAETFGFSPNHLGQLFKEETGRNFSDYVIQLRMEEAQRLLKDTRLKIYEVADRVGYRYLPYFSRQFRETTGMTPLEYRRRQ